MDEIKVYFGLLEVALKQHDRRLVGRVANRLGSIRKRIDQSVLSAVLATYSSSADINCLFSVDSTSPDALPSQEAFAWLIALHFAYDSKQNLQSLPGCCRAIIQRTMGFNMRELDPILARLFSLYVKIGQQISQVAAIHSDLMSSLRTCQLRHDNEALCTIHNGLARVYLLTQQWDLMAKLMQSSPFPTDSASHNQLARHFYYTARLEAVRLNYLQSFECLEQALRKAPQDARSFRTVCYKLFVVVRLLIGEIPSLDIFKDPQLRHYYHLARAVRKGDLLSFKALLAVGSGSARAFSGDGTEGLILRLHQNVLKAGLKRINTSYSRIPLADIQCRLSLDSLEDTVMILMKAIRDRVISGTIEDGAVFCSARPSRPPSAPQDALHHRIVMCQALVQEAVKALRFPKQDGPAPQPEEPRALEDVSDGDDVMMMEEDFGF